MNVGVHQLTPDPQMRSAADLHRTKIRGCNVRFSAGTRANHTPGRPWHVLPGWKPPFAQFSEFRLDTSRQPKRIAALHCRGRVATVQIFHPYIHVGLTLTAASRVLSGTEQIWDRASGGVSRPTSSGILIYSIQSRPPKSLCRLPWSIQKTQMVR